MAKSIATRSFVKCGIRFIVKRENTLDCEVRFRMERSLYRRVMSYYGKKSNWFMTCEIYQQSAGWYAAFQRNEVVNGAIRIIDLISVALTKMNSCQDVIRNNIITLKDVGLKRATYKVKKVDCNGHLRPVAISRSVLAAYNKLTSHLSLIDLLIKNEFDFIASQRNNVSRLQAKFAHNY